MFIHAFLTVLDMTLAGSFVILVVLALRLVLKKAPKVWSWLLWAVVLVRLLCPVQVAAPFSLVPRRMPAAVAYTMEQQDITFWAAADAAQRAVGDVLNGGIDMQWIRLAAPRVDRITGEVMTHTIASWWEVWVLFGQYIWVAGMVIMALRGIWKYRKLKRSLATALPLRDNIYLAEGIPTAFVLGLFRPRIYLPAGLEPGEQAYILAHEQHHLRRWDHVLRLAAFGALCLHWFNPLVWLAYIYSGRDMEMSCDEAVLRRMGGDVRADYAVSLLRFSTQRQALATPLAFGEDDPAGRIKNLAKWRRPARWLAALLVPLVALFAMAFVTSPEKAPKKDLIGVGAVADDAVGSGVKARYHLQLGTWVRSYKVWMELWSNGQCTPTEPVVLPYDVSVLELSMDLAPVAGKDGVALSLWPGEGDVQARNFWLSIPQDVAFTGYGLAPLHPDWNAAPEPGDEYILAGLQLDPGDGIFDVYTCDKLQNDPELLQNAHCTAVVRIAFSDAEYPG